MFKFDKVTAGFFFPSLAGILLFMIPVRWDDKWTIPVKILSDWIAAAMGGMLQPLCVLIITVSAVMGVFALSKPSFIASYPVIDKAFSAAPVWVLIRILGAVFIWLTWLGVDAGEGSTGLIHCITESRTGGFVLSDLLTVLVIIFFLAGVLLPLLLDFGLLEFIGVMLTRVMRPVFTIPGRSAVDCITSWIGDGTLGIMLTANQYESGYYSCREACIIATTFSAVSITFSIVVLAQVNLMEYFGLYYLTICLIGIVCAIILPRIPPLSLKKDTYLVEGKAIGEDLPEGYTSVAQYGFELARRKVLEHRGFGQFLENSLKNAAGMWFGVLPVVMCVGTLTLVLANYTSIFEWLGMPFLPLLNLLQVPEAAEASKTMIIGFTDMFTPSILAAGSITSEMTRFIIAVVSVTQLIYLSEVGGLILASKIPVGLGELFVLFLERTVVSLLIVAPIAHWIF